MTTRALTVLLVACGAREPAPAPVIAPACDDPVADARARLAGSPDAVIEPIANPPDLDGDGRPDLILRSRGGRESSHLLDVVGAGCARFVGRMACAICRSIRG